MKKIKSTQRYCSLFIPYIKKGGEILVYLQKRSKDAKRLPDFFGFWGGGIEDNEKPEEALIREVKEELDYRPNNLSYFGEYDFYPKDKKFVFCSQVGDDFENQIKILEGDYGKFFNKGEALNEEKVIEDDKVVLRDLFRKLNKSNEVLGLKRKTVRLEEYNPQWKVFFDEEKTRFKKLLGNQLLGVEHVGSTSIPGIKAKPILDLMIAIEDLNNWTWLKEPLSKLDYEFRRDYRETQEHILFVKGSEENRTHYLKATELNSDFWIEHILFRDYLINNPKYLNQYQELKERLFKEYNRDREPYTKGKEEFIKMVLVRARKETKL